VAVDPAPPLAGLETGPTAVVAEDAAVPWLPCEAIVEPAGGEGDVAPVGALAPAACGRISMDGIGVRAASNAATFPPWGGI
jgi:hypothetical protein